MRNERANDSSSNSSIYAQMSLIMKNEEDEVKNSGPPEMDPDFKDTGSVDDSLKYQIEKTSTFMFTLAPSGKSPKTSEELTLCMEFEFCSNILNEVSYGTV